MDWSRKMFTLFYICLAPRGPLYHFYIPKYPLPEKLFGVFEHTVSVMRETSLGFDDVFYVPHSRHSGAPQEDIEKRFLNWRFSPESAEAGFI